MRQQHDAATYRDGDHINAYVLTREWRDTPGGIELNYWAATDTLPLLIRVPNTEVVCFIDSNKAGETECAADANALSGSIRPLDLAALSGSRVAGAYFKRQRDLNAFVSLCRAKALRLYESDIKAADRYLMERFVTAPCGVSGDITHDAERRVLRVTNPRLAASDYQPKLKVVSIDIETSFDAQSLYSIAASSDDAEQVFMVRAAHEANADQDAIAIQWCASQVEALDAFFKWIEVIDPDVIIGWNIIGFDLNVLQNLCQQHGVAFSLGRSRRAAKVLKPQSQSDTWVARVPGRAVIDGIDTLRTAFIMFEDFSLQAVSAELLGRGKLISGEDRTTEISDLYQRDPVMLARYNLEDCRLVREIFAHTNLIAFAVERARLTGLALGRAGGSVAAFDNLYLPHLHRAGFVANDRGQTAGGVPSPGGYLIESRPGLYDNVLLFDFKSLYPSIIRTFQIDPMGLAQPGDDPVPGFNGAAFARQGAILPAIISKLWDERDRAKAAGNLPLSQAIKIIMNSFYGVLGANACRFFDPQLASSITRRGHEIIKRTQEYIEQLGYDVIYGDTDSVFVLLGDGVSQSEAHVAGEQIIARLNAWWRDTIAREFQLDSALEMEFESHYDKFLMPTIRGAEKGSKKRYAARIRNHDGSSELIFKGLEAVRSDWTQLAREFQRELYHRVFAGQAFESYVRNIVDDLYHGRCDAKLIYRKRLRRALQDYTRNVPPHVQAARHLDKAGRWVSYVVTLEGPLPVELQPQRPDYDHYRDKQLKPIADAILRFVDSNFDDILSAQLSLFA